MTNNVTHITTSRSFTQHAYVQQELRHKEQLDELFGEWRKSERSLKLYAVGFVVIAFILGIWSGMVIEYLR